MSTSLEWQFVAPSLALAVPASLALAALFTTRAAPFRQALVATAAAVGLAAVLLGGVVLGAPGPSFGVRLDGPTGVVLLLVACIGHLIARYSRSYLERDPGAARYARWLLLTLAAVSALVIANNLLVIAVMWTATSVALHQLLTFFDRPMALMAAHKKFLVSRVADLCMWGGIGLVQHAVGSLDLGALEALVAARPELPAALQLAAVLFVVAACLKSAQLPFHGWLLQVMEAPTPVSALLHAGVVNLGGFLMIRLSPLMAHAPAAQLLLVLVGASTTVLAALVMTTRVSVKVALAWSTCAQMGFMLVECGLGLWHLALLHLVAHSLYKAHAFLSAGTTVEQWKVRALSQARPPLTLGRLALATLAAAAVASAAFAAVAFALGTAHAPSGPTLALALVVALALVPLLARGGVRGALPALGVSALSFGWHGLSERLFSFPTPVEAYAAGPLLVGAAFLALFVVQSALELSPKGRWARALHPWLFAGFFLDERFTRLTFRVWPPRLRAPGRPAPLSTVESTGA